MAKRKPKKKTPDDEPLFDKETEEELGPCKVKGCKLTAIPGERYCALHGMMINGMNYLKENGQEAFANGDWSSGVLNGLGSLALDVLGHAVARVTTPGVNIPFMNNPFAGPPPPPQKPDPFAILGLDPATATVEDVRKMQRELSKLYHADKKNEHVAQSKLAEINAAASEAVAILQNPHP